MELDYVAVLSMMPLSTTWTLSEEEVEYIRRRYPLHYACIRNSVKHIHAHVHRINEHCPFLYGITPYFLACRVSHGCVLDAMFCDVNFNGVMREYGILAACENGNLDAVLTILHSRGDTMMLRCKNSRGMSAVQVACLDASACVLKALLDYLGTHLDVCELHAVINDFDERGMTALHYACARGNAESIWPLLIHCADVNLLDSQGRTPLHVACAFGRVHVVQALLAHEGLRCCLVDRLGRTAMQIALDSDVARLVEKRSLITP